MNDKRAALLLSVLIVVAVIGITLYYSTGARQQARSVGQEVRDLGQDAKTGVQEGAEQTKKAAEDIKEGVQNAVH